MENATIGDFHNQGGLHNSRRLQPNFGRGIPKGPLGGSTLTKDSYLYLAYLQKKKYHQRKFEEKCI